MATLGKAVIEFSADTAKFVGDVGRTAAMFDKSMARMEGAVANLRNALAATAALGGIGSLIKGTIDAGEELHKLSQKVGVQVERLSELKFAADLADVGMDDLTRGFKEFNKTLTEATDPNSKAAGIFSALGMSPSGDPAADLRKVAEAFSQLQDGATKTTIAGELFGKSGLSWIPLLNEGGAALDRAAESGRKMGLIIGPELARQSDVFNNNLKILNKQAEALGKSLTEHVIGGLSTLTSRLVEGVEKGSAFTTMLKEWVFLVTALGEKLRIIPQAMGEGVFRFLDGSNRGGPVDFNKTMAEHAARWGQGGGGTASVLQAPPNADALACVASGGKWVNGKCVRAGTAAAKGDDNLLGRQLAEDMEEQARTMREAWQATSDFYQKQRDAEKGLEDTRMKAWLEFIDRSRERDEIAMRAAAGFDELGNKIKEVEKSSFDFGFTFNSALEDVILNITKAGDAIDAFGKDLARMIVRKGITDPLGKGVDALMGPITKGIGSIFSGLIPSFDTGTPYVPRDTLAMVHKGEAIIPASQNHGGGGPINVTLNVGSLDPRTAAHVILANEGTIKGMFRRAAKWRGEA